MLRLFLANVKYHVQKQDGEFKAVFKLKQLL